VSQDRPTRVRVTAPPRRAAANRPVDLESDSRLDGVYLDSLLAAQLRLAGRLLLVLAFGVGALPLTFFLAPGLAGKLILGIPVPWLLLGVVVYPVLVLMGWLFVVRAERNERDLVDITRQVDR